MNGRVSSMAVMIGRPPARQIGRSLIAWRIASATPTGRGRRRLHQRRHCNEGVCGVEVAAQTEPGHDGAWGIERQGVHDAVLLVCVCRHDGDAALQKNFSSGKLRYVRNAARRLAGCARAQRRFGECGRRISENCCRSTRAWGLCGRAISICCADSSTGAAYLSASLPSTLRRLPKSWPCPRGLNTGVRAAAFLGSLGGREAGDVDARSVDERRYRSFQQSEMPLRL
jgi:hypothetical protein